jgi:hypothetical protein
MSYSVQMDLLDISILAMSHIRYTLSFTRILHSYHAIAQRITSIESFVLSIIGIHSCQCEAAVSVLNNLILGLECSHILSLPCALPLEQTLGWYAGRFTWPKKWYKQASRCNIHQRRWDCIVHYDTSPLKFVGLKSSFRFIYTWISSSSKRRPCLLV